MTTVTTREIMTLPVLQGAYVLGGREGLDRAVTGVNVMEVPDIEDFVAPGELLLTTAYPVRDRPERLVELLPVLAARGLAALAIKPLRYLDRLPDRLAAEADRLRFPVLVVPDRTSFNEVIGAVLAIVLAEYGAEPGGAEAIRERLTGVVLAGGGLDEIARTLAGALDREVTVVDTDGVTLGRGVPHRASPGAPHDDAVAAPWRFAITVAGAERGRILVGGDDEPSLGQRRLVRQACFAAGMHMAQALASLELDRRLRTLFLEELVTGPTIDEPTLRQRSRLFGWDLAGDHVVILARCASELAEPAVAAAARRVLPASSLSWTRGEEVVVIAPLDAVGAGVPDRARAVAMGQRWRDALLDLGVGRAIVAIGSTARGLTQVPASHGAARDALRIAASTGQTVVHHGALVLERVLQSVPAGLLAELVASEVGALAEYDAASGADLCGTLEAYIGYGNGAHAARALYIHYNTMKHRLARIVELTGADLHDARTRLRLAIALEARKLG
jgi:purine catabolism regulator